MDCEILKQKDRGLMKSFLMCCVVMMTVVAVTVVILRSKVIKMTVYYIQDSLATATLAAVIPDEYERADDGGPIISLGRVRELYEKCVDSLTYNIGLTKTGEENVFIPGGSHVLVDLTIEDFRIYSVNGERVTQYTIDPANPDLPVTQENVGRVGEVNTPNGHRITATSAYCKIGIHYKTIKFSLMGLAPVQDSYGTLEKVASVIGNTDTKVVWMDFDGVVIHSASFNKNATVEDIANEYPTMGSVQWAWDKDASEVKGYVEREDRTVIVKSFFNGSLEGGVLIRIDNGLKVETTIVEKNTKVPLSAANIPGKEFLYWMIYNGENPEILSTEKNTEATVTGATRNGYYWVEARYTNIRNPYAKIENIELFKEALEYRFKVSSVYSLAGMGGVSIQEVGYLVSSDVNKINYIEETGINKSKTHDLRYNPTAKNVCKIGGTSSSTGWVNGNAGTFNASIYIPQTVSSETTYIRPYIIFKTSGEEPVKVAYGDVEIITTKITVSVSPISITTRSNLTSKLKVIATGTSLKYEWKYLGEEYSGLGASGWKTALDEDAFTGTYTDELSIVASSTGISGNLIVKKKFPKTNNMKFQCIVSNGVTTASSEIITMSVDDVITIEKQPSTIIVPLKGGMYSLSIRVKEETGNVFKYEWQYTTDNGATWNKVNESGANSSTVTMRITPQMSNRKFRCVVTCGQEEKVSHVTDSIIYSDSASIATVNFQYHLKDLSGNGTYGDNNVLTTSVIGGTGKNMSELLAIAKSMNNIPTGAKESSVKMKVSDSDNPLLLHDINDDVVVFEAGKSYNIHFYFDRITCTLKFVKKTGDAGISQLKINGETRSFGSPYVYTYGTRIVVTAEIKSGYMLDEWYETKLGSINKEEFVIDPIAADGTYTVSSKPLGYTIAYKNVYDTIVRVNSASVGDAFNVQTPTRDGYEFQGWTIRNMQDGIQHFSGMAENSLNSTFEGTEAKSQKGTWYKNLSEKQTQIEFEAEWQVNQYKFKIVCDKGNEQPIPQMMKGDVVDKNLQASGEEYTVKYDETFAIKTPQVPGYNFVGWKVERMDESLHVIGGKETRLTTYENSQGKNTEMTYFKNLRGNSSEVVTITAVWEPIKYTVEIKGDQNELGLSKMIYECEYDKTIVIPTPKTIINGQSFSGWKVETMSGDPWFSETSESNLHLLDTSGRVIISDGDITFGDFTYWKNLTLKDNTTISFVPYYSYN